MQVGSRLKDTYEIVRELASGGMGAIFEARHVRLGGKQFAVKVIRRDLAGQTEVLERFKREAEVIAGLRHPNVVEVVDYDVSPEGEPYLIMELLEGESLDQLLEREQALAVDLAVGIVRQALLALGHAHERGVVHRDIKPANLFLVPSGDRLPFVKLLDFGIAKALTASHQLTMTRELLGTPAYMAPEQVMGAGAGGLGPHTDVYAIGAVLYHLLGGKPPLEANDMAAMVYAVAYREPIPLGQPGSLSAAVASRVTIPQPVADVVWRALRKQPQERWSSAHEMRVALDDALDRVRAGAFAAATPSAFSAVTPPAHGTQPAQAVTPPPGGFVSPSLGAGRGPLPATREMASTPGLDPRLTPVQGGIHVNTPTPRPIAATQLTPTPGLAAAVGAAAFAGATPAAGAMGATTPVPAFGGGTPAPGGFGGPGTPPPGSGYLRAATPTPGGAYTQAAAPPERRSLLGPALFVIVLLVLSASMVVAAWYVTDGFREANNPFARGAGSSGGSSGVVADAGGVAVALAEAGAVVVNTMSASDASVSTITHPVEPDSGLISTWAAVDAAATLPAQDAGVLVATLTDAGVGEPNVLDAGAAVPVPVGDDDDDRGDQPRREDPVAAARRAGTRAIRARSAAVTACSVAAGFMGRVGGRFRYRADGTLDSVTWHGSYPSSFRNCVAAQLRGIRIRPLPRGLSYLDVDVSWNTASPR